MPTLRGERHGRAKLTWRDVDEIRTALADGESVMAMAEEFMVDRRTIRRLRDGETWTTREEEP